MHISPVPPTGPRGGDQSLPGEGSHFNGVPEHGSQLASKNQESTGDQLTGLLWVGGFPWPFQAVAAVPLPTDVVVGPTG